MAIEKDKYTFEEAIIVVRPLGLKYNDWDKYTKSDDFDERLPKDPYYQYKNRGWKSFPHFLTGVDDIEFYSYEEAIVVVRPLGLKTQNDWRKYTKSDDFDERLPKDPRRAYKNKGFISMPHFLGYFGNGSHQWSKSLALEFISHLEDNLANLTSGELLVIINSKNLTDAIRKTGLYNTLISTKPDSIERLETLQEIQTILSETLSEDENDVEDELDDNNEDINEETISEQDINVFEEVHHELPTFSPLTDIRAFDNELLVSSISDEVLDFLLKQRVKMVWNEILNKRRTIEELQSETYEGINSNLIKNVVIDEYNNVKQIQIPNDYCFDKQPNLMQLLTSYRLIQNKCYGNWSGTGAGKTLSAILSGRLANAYNTVIICNNATVEGWVKSINSYFVNNNIYTKNAILNTNLYNIDKTILPGNQYNYIILNYETFQQDNGEYIVDKIIENNKIDYLILDEIQNVKQREENVSSIRKTNVSKLRFGLSQINSELLVLAMTATPVINNYIEAKYLIELLSGLEHNDIETKENINNGIKIYEYLTRYGLRYIPNYNIEVNEEIIVRDGSHLIEELLNIKSNSPSLFEKVLITDKLLAIQNYIKKGTLIYSYFTTDIIENIKSFVENLGFSVGLYTGDEKEGLDKFRNGEIDVLIGSAPVTTGVDGIQYVCDTLIPIILPWTSSEYDQLLGRVIRQGSNFDKVNVYIPQISIDTWNYDNYRMNIILHKESIADLAVDCIIPTGKIPTHTKLITDAQQKLRELRDNILNDTIPNIERNPITVDISACDFEKKQKVLQDFSQMNKEWSVSKSSTIKDRLDKDKSEWHYYHKLYREKRENWTEIPYKVISDKIKRSDWLVGDLGCGENLLSKEITNTVYGFDYVAIDDTVTACDISNLPLSDEYLDVVVFSLSLMGSNKIDYIKEAYRVLKPLGFIYVAEPYTKWESRENELIEMFENIGFRCYPPKKSACGKFIYLDGTKN